MSRVLNNQNKPNEKEPLTQKLVKVGPIPQMNKPETESLGMFWIEILKTVPEGQKTKMTELIIEHQFREQQFQREQQNLERELEREQQNREHREREFQQNREHREREFQREEENYQQHKKLLELKMRLARDPDNQTLKSEIKAQDEFLEKCVLLMPKHTDKSVEDGEPNLTKKTKVTLSLFFFKNFTLFNIFHNSLEKLLCFLERNPQSCLCRPRKLCFILQKLRSKGFFVSGKRGPHGGGLKT